jgi:hypothetical protein
VPYIHRAGPSSARSLVVRELQLFCFDSVRVCISMALGQREDVLDSSQESQLLDAAEAAQQHHNQLLFSQPSFGSQTPPPPLMCRAFVPPQATPSESHPRVIEARFYNSKYYNRFTAVKRLRRRMHLGPAAAAAAAFPLVRQQGLRPPPDPEAPRLYPLPRCLMELLAAHRPARKTSQHAHQHEPGVYDRFLSKASSRSS